MEVYIKGIEMPQGEEMLCINVYPDGKVYIDLDLHCKRVATAIPVPPHGRLIDADALKEKILQARVLYQMLDDTQTADKIMHGIYRVEQILAEAPTVIPAEEGE